MTYRGILRRRTWFRNLKGRQNSGREEGLRVYLRKRKNSLVKIYEMSAAYGRVKNLQKSTSLKPSKLKLLPEGQNTHTKHSKYRKRFPTLKVIAYDTSQIWSLYLGCMVILAEEKKRRKTLAGCGGLSLTLSLSRTLKIKESHNNSRCVLENDKEQAT